MTKWEANTEVSTHYKRGLLGCDQVKVKPIMVDVNNGILFVRRIQHIPVWHDDTSYCVKSILSKNCQKQRKTQQSTMFYKKH